MLILGIDPGYAIVGWAVMEITGPASRALLECGVIETDKGLPMATRLKEVYDDINLIIDRFSPDYAGIEKVMLHKNVKTATKVGEATGVILLALEEKDIPIYEVTPLQVKNAVSGYGRADKAQVQRSVKLLCGLEEAPKPDDAADAVAIAITAYDHIVTNTKQELY